jgi:hypothetical protein
MVDINMAALSETVIEAASRYINSRAPELPPLRWSMRSDAGRYSLDGHVSRAEHSGTAEVAEQWRTALGLSLGEGYKGVSEFVGDVNGTHVTVWHVSDETEFDR